MKLLTPLCTLGYANVNFIIHNCTLFSIHDNSEYFIGDFSISIVSMLGFYSFDRSGVDSGGAEGARAPQNLRVQKKGEA